MKNTVISATDTSHEVISSERVARLCDGDAKWSDRALFTIVMA